MSLATYAQRRAITERLWHAIPSDLTEAEAALLLEKMQNIVSTARGMVNGIIRPRTDAFVEIKFELDGQPFDATRVSGNGEAPLFIEEALAKADTDGRVVRSASDWQSLYTLRNHMPVKLTRHWLCTARPHPNRNRCVSCLFPCANGWREGWSSLDDMFDGDGLIVCVGV